LDGFTSLTHLLSHVELLGGQLELTAWAHPSYDGCLTGSRSSLPDQLALIMRDGREDGRHHPTGGRAEIDALSQAAQDDAALPCD